MEKNRLRVLFLVPYPVGTVPGQRLKFEQHFSYFKENGVECTVRPFIFHQFYKILYKKGRFIFKIAYTILGFFYRMADTIRAINYDVIYLFLWACPIGPPVFEYLLRWMKKPIVYDIDDIVYKPHSSPANRIAQPLKFTQKVPKIISMSAHVIVVTKYLEQYAEKFNKNVTFIPPTIDTDKYCVKKKNYNNTSICVGWSGSHTTIEYLTLIKDVLYQLKGKYNIKIKVIGDSSFSLPGIDIVAIDWNSKDEVKELQEIDIGLYPLPKREWVLGKGGLKALQYMGLGIPTVSTRIGAVLDFVEDGVNGFLADSQEEWIDKISRLIENAELRERMGNLARKSVEEKYSVKVNAPKLLTVLKKVYSENKKS